MLKRRPTKAKRAKRKVREARRRERELVMGAYNSLAAQSARHKEIRKHAVLKLQMRNERRANAAKAGIAKSLLDSLIDKALDKVV